MEGIAPAQVEPGAETGRDPASKPRAAQGLLTAGGKSRAQRRPLPAHSPRKVTSCRRGQRQASRRGCLGFGVWPQRPGSWLRMGSAVQSLPPCLVAEPRGGPDFRCSLFVTESQRTGQDGRNQLTPTWTMSSGKPLEPACRSDVLSPDSSAWVGWVGASSPCLRG